MTTPRTSVRTAAGQRLRDDQAFSDAHREVLSAAIAAIEVEAGALDRAWAEAEAALPEGWRIDGLHNGEPRGWFVVATNAAGDDVIENDFDPTPVTALHALAARLREAAE